jgi:predicted transposase YdaD
MNDYDATLKGILTRPDGKVLLELTGFAIERWHNIELPAVRHRLADLLGETADGRLVHLELQSTNQAHMAVRMLEYSLAIRRKFRRFPEQVVLYVGNAPMRMRGRLSGPGLSYECRFADIREVDAEPLLASGCLEDNVIADLARIGDQREAVRRILTRIGERDSQERETALSELLVLAGLRKLGTVLETEIRQMPILDDIMDHEVIGRERRRGMAIGREVGREEGREVGREEGREVGREEGQRELLFRLVDKRFGPLPEWAKQRIGTLSASELEDIGLRLLDAVDLKELLP